MFDFISLLFTLLVSAPAGPPAASAPATNHPAIPNSSFRPLWPSLQP